MINSKRTIVVVDDDENQLNLLADYLSGEGFDVHIAPNGREGLRIIQDIRPDMVVLDMVLPDMSGSDVCSELRASASTQAIPIILCTAHKISPDDKIKGFRSGADDYLVRPFELSELSARITAVLRRTSLQPKTDILAGIQLLLKAQEPVAAPTPDPSPVPALPPLPPAPTVKKPFLDIPVNPLNPVLVTEPSMAPPEEMPNFFKKLWHFLNHPAKTFKGLNEREDFFLAVLLVLGTPTIASFLKVFQRGDGFDSWIGYFSLGLVVHVILWFATAGLLHLLLPFQGLHVPMKKALLLAGLAWAPRFLEAVLALVYGGMATFGLAGSVTKFSSGLNMIPGLPDNGLLSFVSKFGLFNLWSAWLILISVWTLGHAHRPRWSFVTVLLGGLCLLIGALSNF